jgi:hypothetical protein
MTGRVLALATAVLLLLAGPAHAERSLVRDGTGDVWSPEGARSWTHEGSVVNTDLTKTVVDHRAGAVAVTASYVELRRRVSDEISLDFTLRTSERRVFSIYVQEDWLFRGTYVPVLDVETQELIDCPGATGSSSIARRTITFTVPRRCLGNPAWVRYQFQAESYSEGGGLYVDDARGRGPEPKVWSRKLYAG